MRVQRVVMPDSDAESWTVLDEGYRVVEPVEAFLVHLCDQERSPNTVRSYAYDLRDFFEYLRAREVGWAAVTLEVAAGFKPWLRLPVAARRGAVSALPSVEARCCESTINRKLAAVLSFYEFHRRHGVDVGLRLEEGRRPARLSRTAWRPFLAHASGWRPQRRELKLRTPQRKVRVLSEEQVQVLLDACDRLRDRFLLAVLYDAGLRLGEALGLRHDDLCTADLAVEVRPRQNANGARAKTWERTVPASAGLFRLHAEYLCTEYGDLDSDYVFVSLFTQKPGRALSFGAVYDLVSRLCRRTGIAFTPHMFRHTYATRLLRQGVGLEVVQRLLGACVAGHDT
jgi:integrase/recombinase XerD